MYSESDDWTSFEEKIVNFELTSMSTVTVLSFAGPRLSDFSFCKLRLEKCDDDQGLGVFLQNGSSNGALLIKNAQLKHGGHHTCTAQTPIDNVTASAQLVVRGES